MSGKGIFGILLVAIVVIVGSQSIYTVDEREKAIVRKFGEVIRSDDPPGLHFKVPFVNNVQKFDARVQTMDAAPQEYLTFEKKNLVVDSFVKWRVDDVKQYYVAVQGDKLAAENRLAQRVNDSLREQFGKRTVQEVISGERGVIMDIVQKKTNEQAREIGVEVVDVRLKRVDLVDEVSERVYKRMEAERSRVAKELRAQGAEEAEKIRADAERQREIIIANAFRDAEKIRGEGDAEATETYAQAFGKDSEFYTLYRSLNAYENTFSSNNDLLVIEPDSEFFKYFKDAVPSSSNSSPSFQ